MIYNNLYPSQWLKAVNLIDAEERTVNLVDILDDLPLRSPQNLIEEPVLQRSNVVDKAVSEVIKLFGLINNNIRNLRRAIQFYFN